MWGNAQRDGHPVEYIVTFSAQCRKVADAHYLSAMQ